MLFDPTAVALSLSQKARLCRWRTRVSRREKPKNAPLFNEIRMHMNRVVRYLARSAIVATAFTISVVEAAETKASQPRVGFLGLPRLKTVGNSAEPRMAANKFTTDRLLPQGAAGAKSAVKADLKFLTLDAGKEWSRPLRGSPHDVTFVSFLAYGSEGTAFDVGGARLLIRPGKTPGSAQVTAVNPSAPSASAANLTYTVRIEQHDKAALAALPIFTVRIDPSAGVWDLYSFDHVVFEDIPLSSVNGARKFSVQAGKEGAWVCGLVMADENPLFIDANANGIDDAFETKTNNGALLGANASANDRTRMLVAWKASQHTNPPKSWSIKRPQPDGAATAQ
jgi:hypothetical protein